MKNSENNLDRKEVIYEELINLISFQIVNIDKPSIIKWVDAIDKNLSKKTTNEDIRAFMNEFVIGARKWDKFKGISNILVFPLRDYTEQEIQARRLKLGID